MPYKDSYIYSVRQKIGNDLLIVPSADAIVIDDRGRVLLVMNKDVGQWTTPGGYAEPNQTSAECAARELLEEAGIQVDAGDLVPFAFMSGYTMTYANGDKLQPFTQYFFTNTWIDVHSNLDSDEVSDRKWFTIEQMNELNLNPRTSRALKALSDYMQTGRYQMIDQSNSTEQLSN